ncbi:MAG: helix-turn-helix domain-containing protein [Pseudomonadota bacterium]|nr:helix-turn-helix domain-containing protein [Pseudomonadota bacterium]
MRTLTLKEAAEFLHVHPVTLLRMTRNGKIPAAKPGKCWVFIDIDLLDWLRAQYPVQASMSDHQERSLTCHSSGAKIRPRGGSNSRPQMDDAYSKALGLPTD